MAHGIIWWIVVGLIAGWVAGRIMKGGGHGVIADILLGIVGAVVGCFIFRAVGASGVTGLNVYSLIVAVIGSIVFLSFTTPCVGLRSDVVTK